MTSNFVSGQLTEDDRSIRHLFRRSLRKAVVATVFWRLLLISVVVGSLVLTHIIGLAEVHKNGLILWVVLALGLVFALFSFRRASTFEGVGLSLAFFMWCLFGWWLLAHGYQLWSDQQAIFALIVIVLSLGFIPSLGLIQDLTYLSIAILSIGFSVFHNAPVSTLILLVGCFLAFRNTLILGSQSLVCAGTLSIIRMRDQLTLQQLRMLMLEGLSLVFRLNRFGIAQEGSPSLLCIKNRGEWIASHHSPISEVAPDILRLEGEGGLIHPTALGYEFALRIREAFGLTLDSIGFFSLNEIIDEKKPVRLFFPLNYLFTLSGKQHAFRLSLLFLSSVGQGFSLTNAREFGTNKFQEVSQLLDEQRSDLNQIIHLVNNVTQELNASLNEVPSEKNRGEAKKSLVSEVSDSLYSLAADVSDYRMAREIDELMSFPDSERVHLMSFQHSIERYTSALARRGGITCAFTTFPLAAKMDIEANESLCQFVYRCLFRIVIRHLRPGSTIAVQCHGSEGEFVIEVQGDSTPSGKSSGVRLSAVEKIIISRLPTLRQHFRSLEIGGEDPNSGILSRFRMQFLMKESVGVSQETRAHWILFVDDNKQILSLYERIASALQLDFRSSTNMQDAIQLVGAHGMPSLLVTDAELEDGSGKLLLDSLERDGYVLPKVLVISGAGEAELRKMFAGRDSIRLLTKPVSQQHLIKTIRELLN